MPDPSKLKGVPEETPKTALNVARVAPVLVAAPEVGFAAACHGAAAVTPALPVVLEEVAMSGSTNHLRARSSAGYRCS